MEKIFENFRRYQKLVLKEEREPLAISVLGAPAAGKTYTRNLIGDIAKRFQTAADTGKNLTVDVIRDEFLKLPASERLPEFFNAFYTLKDFALKNPQFTKWFTDVQGLWNGKLANLINQATRAEYSADNKNIFVNGKIANLDAFVRTIQGHEEKIAAGLHPYKDQKRVVRHLQLSHSNMASDKRQDVMYDETGDEPDKMVTRLKDMHNKGYVTDAILVHPSSVIVNLLQNASRMINGEDGGRDSSSSIVSAYNDIAAGISTYEDASEVDLATSSDKLKQDTAVKQALSGATTTDDKSRGNLPIDVFVQVDTQSVVDTYNRVANEFSDQAQEVLKAVLVLQVNNPSLGVSADTKRDLQKYVSGLPTLVQAQQTIKNVKLNPDPNEAYGQPMTGVLAI